MELKARHVVDVYDDYSEHPCEERSQVYLKPDADKVIAHYKYKRCLAMARICENKLGTVVKPGWWNKWYKRWLKLAKHYKEAK